MSFKIVCTVLFVENLRKTFQEYLLVDTYTAEGSKNCTNRGKQID